MLFVLISYIFKEYLEATSYIQGELGSDSCPKGYKTITDPGTCQTASNRLGLNYSEELSIHGAKAICNWCGGCSMTVTRMSEHQGNVARWICRIEEHYFRFSRKFFLISLYKFFLLNDSTNLFWWLKYKLLRLAINCKWGNWDIGDCSVTCGTGTRKNRRVKLVEENIHGTCNGAFTDDVQCKKIPCPGIELL